MKQNNGIGKVLVGAAVGVAAGAAAIALTDKNNRKKLGKTVKDISTQAQKFSADMQKNPKVKKAVKQSAPMLKKAGAKAAKALN